MKRRKSIFAALILMALLLTAGGQTVLAEADAPATIVQDAPQMYSPTTGLATGREYKPVLVSYTFSNADWDVWGVSQADIVYEFINWAPGHTRFEALFNDNHPSQVGPIRGARTYGASLRQAWDCPYVHRGGQDVPGTSIYDFFAQYEVTPNMRSDGTRGGECYVRIEDIVSPHNLSFDLESYVRLHWPKDAQMEKPYAPRDPGLTFASKPSTSNVAVSDVLLAYAPDVFQVSYYYNADEGAWLRSYNGSSNMDALTGEQLKAQNLIIQACRQTYFENVASRPVIEMTGSGPFVALINGRLIEGQWKRLDEDSQFVYTDMDGRQLKLLPGKTFVHVVPTEMYETMDISAPSGVIKLTNISDPSVVSP